MTAVLRPQVQLDTLATLHVEREDITFSTLADHQVAVRIRVRNRGRQRSRATTALLQAAPLGAFVAWRPLTVVAVPALEPDEEYVVSADARRVAPAVLGDASRVPPQRLLTALANDDDPNRRDRTAAAPLPADLLDLLGRPNPHWAGNLNIFLSSRPVERHLAQALRVYPGRVNLAMFVVGSGHDAYAFELHGVGVTWNTALFCMDRAASLVDLRGGTAVAQKQWLEVRGTSTMMLALEPPRRCAKGAVEVHVRQRSTGQVAVVEFSLDPNAAGPGCYTV